MPMGGPRASVGRIQRELAFIAVARLNSSPCSRPDLIWTRSISPGRMISGDEPSSDSSRDSSLNVAGVSNLHLIPASNSRVVVKPKGDRDGQRPAKRQSRSQEAQEREDQGHCRSAEPKGCGMAAGLCFRQEEVEIEIDRLELI